ncbi:MAG: hypothetical protein MJZ45_01705 [Bacteroidales bacterium]|nr:hypothetical protein [Bacteroidales bacterium]
MEEHSRSGSDSVEELGKFCNADEKQYWSDYFKELEKAREDSEIRLDQRLYTIPTGAIAIMLGTIGIKLQSEFCYEWLFVGALLSFVLALILSIIHHLFLSNDNAKILEQICQLSESGSDKKIENIKKHIIKNQKVSQLRFLASVILITLGIILYGMWICINLANH